MGSRNDERRRVDVVVRGLGRNGDRFRMMTASPTQRDTARAIVRKLRTMGNLELLRAWHDDRFSTAEIINYDRLGQLGRALDDLAGRKPLFERDAEGKLALSAFVVDIVRHQLPRGGEETQRRYLHALQHLLARQELRADATLEALRRVDWKGWYASWHQSEASWNQLRAAVSVLLSVALGDQHHSLRNDVLRAFPRGRDIEREPDLTPETFERILQYVRPEVRCCYQTILILDVRLGEYLSLTREDLRADTFEVRVRGRERAGGRRRLKDPREGYRVMPVEPELWPIINGAVPCPFGEDWLRDMWDSACDKAGVTKRTQEGKRDSIRLHDLRHTLLQWLSDEGVDQSALQKYAGHKTAAMTARYQRRRLRKKVAVAVAKVFPRSENPSEVTPPNLKVV